MPIVVRRARDRFTTSADGITSWHCFSFGRHYDPSNVGHGVLVAHNEEVLAPGSGFGSHAHRDMEIVTWMLQGRLLHEDSEGNRGVLHPGLAQRMSAGSGVVHSERNDPSEQHEAARFVQMWVLPHEPDLPDLPDHPGEPEDVRVAPGYEQREVGDLTGKGLVTVATGIPGRESMLRIGSDAAALDVATLRAGESVVLPEAPYLHLFVARGSVDLEGVGPLWQGDSARFTTEPPRTVTGRPGAPLGEVLVWEMHAGR